MDVLDIIKERRSIRKYKEKIPSDSDIKKILEAGRWAPSGLNNQPWRFLVIRDRAIKKDLANFTKYGNIIKGAPVVLAVFMDIADSYNREKDLMAIGACIQNMMLQAYSMGLGTCWLGEILNKKEEVMKYLNDPSGSFSDYFSPRGHPEARRAEGSHAILRRFAPQDEQSTYRKNSPTAHLNIGDDLELMALVAMGYSHEKVTKGSRKPLKSLVLDNF